MNWLYYLAEANLYLGVFYLAYCLFLTKETYYQLTRAYLLFACVVSFILPVLQIGALKPVEAAVTSTVTYIPEYTEPAVYTPIAATPVVVKQHLTVQDYLVYAYLVGAGTAFLMLMVKLFTLFRLMHSAEHVKQDKHKLLYLPGTNVAFSFFNYLFIGTDAPGTNTIIRHELVHIRQRHSVDIVFLELLKVINWFNPFIYLLQNSLKTVHEYIADEQTAAFETDALTYSSFLVKNAYGAGGSSITHSFFNYNLLKKRIVMLNQKRSGNLARLKYLVTVPVCAGLLCVSTLAFSKTYGWVDIDPAKPVSVEVPKVVPPAQKVVKAKGFKYPLPTISTDGYEKLITYLSKTMRYDNALIKPTNIIVVINFKVNADRKISDAKISRSGGSAFDVLAMNALKSYKSTVNDKPGNRNLMFDFYANDSTPQEMAIVNGKLDNSAGFVVIIPNRRGPGPVKFPPPVVSKPTLHKRDKNGAYINEGRLNNGAVPIQTIAPKGTKALFIVDGKRYEFTPKSLAKYNSKSLLYMSCDKMVVYEQGNAYAEKKWGKGYGKVAVLTGNAVIKIVEHPFGNKKETPAVDTITKAGLTAFYTYLTNNIRYPSSERDEGINGRATVEFNVDNNNHLTYIKIIRSPSDNLSREIIRGLKDSPYLKAFKGGTWTLPVEFNLNGNALATSYLPLSNIVYNPNGFNVPAYVPTQKLTEVVVKGYTKAHLASATTLDFEQLGRYFANNIRYPVADRHDTISGPTVTFFEIVTGGRLLYAKVGNTPSDLMSDEILETLKNCPELAVLKPGIRYILPVIFRLGNEHNLSEMAPKYRSIKSIKSYNPKDIKYSVSPPKTQMLAPIVVRGYI